MPIKTLNAEIYGIFGTGRPALRLHYKGRGLLETLKDETITEKKDRARLYAQAHGFTRIKWHDGLIEHVTARACKDCESGANDCARPRCYLCIGPTAVGKYGHWAPLRLHTAQ